MVGHFKPTAMMDISDGLAKDAGRLAAASGCGLMLDELALPLTPGCDMAQALGDGEDFELLFTLSPGEAKRLFKTPPKGLKTTVTAIGEITGEKSGFCLEDESGKKVHVNVKGYEHFA